MKAANFAATGNIEMVFNGDRLLLGQFVDGVFRLKQWCQPSPVFESRASRRIQQCADIARRHGIEPKFEVVDYE